MNWLIALFAATFVSAQNVGVKVNDISTDGTEETTITVKKGGKLAPNEIRYEITEGTEEVEGEPAPLQKAARANWKKACDEWRKEFRENNRENQIITLNCGKADCATSTMETTCKSTGKYKMKIRMN